METCKVENCGNNCVAKGYCRKHYMQIRRNGQIRDPNKKICSVDGCNSRHHAKGYCSKHYREYLLKGEITTNKVHKKCILEGCENKSRALGLCYKHYVRLRRKRKNSDSTSLK